MVRRNYQAADGARRVREFVRHPGAVTILPLVGEGNVCLIRNHRHSIKRTLIELPAGTLEAGEEPSVCAHRELAEETGYRARRMELLCEFYMSPGVLDERTWLFVADDLTAGEVAPDEGEEIENLIVTWDEALAMIRDGSIQDAKTIVGLLRYDDFRRARA